MGFNEYSKEMHSTDRKTWLGELAWYTVPESARVDTETLRQALSSVGLEGFMPKAPADHDIFKRVCSANERKRIETNEGGVFENFLIRNVSQKNRRVVRQIVVERRNENNERLGYAPQVQIEFDGRSTIRHSILLSDERENEARELARTLGYASHAYLDVVPTSDSRAAWLNGDRSALGAVVFDNYHFVVHERPSGYATDMTQTVVVLNACHPEAIAVAQAIEADYYAERQTFNSYILRALIRRVLEDSRATTVRAGVYFVMAENAGRVNSLEVLQDALPIEVHTLPLLDSAKQRQMLRNAFEAETVGEIDKLMAEMDSMSTMSPDKYADFVTQMKELKAKTGEYSSLLEDALGEADFRLTVFEAKVRATLNKVAS